MVMSQSEEPTFAALIGAVVAAVDGMVIGGTVCPGLLLCVPAILFVVVPMLAVGLLVAILVLVPTGVVFAAAMVGKLSVRVARGLSRRLPAPRARRERVATTGALLTLTEGSAERHA
jgi:hypothetical protein